MIGFVLAAGFGTRLRPLTDNIPKALVPLCGIPLLERNLQILHSADINKLCANMHYLPDKMSQFKDSCNLSFELFYEDPIRGTGGAIFGAKDYLCTDDSFVVSNADIVHTIQLEPLIKNFIDSDAECTLLATTANGMGTIQIDEHSNYAGLPSLEYYDKYKQVDFIGTAFYKHSVLKHFFKDDFSIVPIWKRLQDKGLKVSVEVVCDCMWMDTGTPKNLMKLYRNIIDGLFPTNIPSGIVIDPTRKTGFDLKKSSDYASIKGEYFWIDPAAKCYASILNNCIILGNAFVANKAIKENCIITEWGEISVEK